jgi:hypothetical protein
LRRRCGHAEHELHDVQRPERADPAGEALTEQGRLGPGRVPVRVQGATPLRWERHGLVGGAALTAIPFVLIHLPLAFGSGIDVPITSPC